MPLVYKEPLFWEHKKVFTRAVFGDWEKEVVAKILERIPYGSEVKITFQWNRNKMQRELEKREKKLGIE